MPVQVKLNIIGRCGGENEGTSHTKAERRKPREATADANPDLAPSRLAAAFSGVTLRAETPTMGASKFAPALQSMVRPACFSFSPWVMASTVAMLANRKVRHPVTSSSATLPPASV